MGPKVSCPAMPPDVHSLHIAIVKNDVEEVERLISNGVDVNIPWKSPYSPYSVKNGTTPLCASVSLNHRQITECLISGGAHINQPDSCGRTPLHKAAYHGRHFLAEMLINAGAEIDLKDLNMNTQLNLCVQNAEVHNNIDTVRTLIKAGGQVNTADSKGRIPLHYSARSGLVDVTEILIKAGSQIDHSDWQSKTPFYFCVRPRDRDTLKRPPLEDISERKHRKYFLRNIPVIKVLITNGCDTLNFSSWLMRQRIECDDFSSDYISYPDSLQQLCRSAIQRFVAYDGRDLSRIQALPLPQSMLEYLGKQLFVIVADSNSETER